MSHAKILYQISGSIAAYKSATVISKLVQAGFEVQTVVTRDAQRFIGLATLEGLTGKPVLLDLFETDKMMDHINLVKWADLVVLAPATGNTINRLAAGLADNLVGALFLAHDWSKPYLLAPAMNVNMISHPATQSALEKLQQWGVKVLPTAEGYLACGDEGRGKMLEPEQILDAIMNAAETIHRNSDQSPRILITSGSTREAIDAVRFVSNISTGKTGAAIADRFIRSGVGVTYLHGTQAHFPELPCQRIGFDSTSNLDSQLSELLSSNSYDAVIHLAAISDYVPKTIRVEQKNISLPTDAKLSSSPDQITVTLGRNPKLIQKIKTSSKNKSLKLIGFKLTANSSADDQRRAALKLLKETACDLVVGNDMVNRTDGRQSVFLIYERNSKSDPEIVSNVNDLGDILYNRLFIAKGESR